MKVEWVKSFNPGFFCVGRLHEKSRDESRGADGLTFYFAERFSELSSCCLPIFLFFCSCSVSSVRVRFDSIRWGSHPGGCRIANERRRRGPVMAELESQKSEDRFTIWRREEQKVLPTAKDDNYTPEQQYLVFTRSETSLIWKGHEFFAPGHHV